MKLIHHFPSFSFTHSLFGIADQPMCFFAGHVGGKQQDVGCISNLRMFSFRFFISLILCECVVLIMNVRRNSICYWKCCRQLAQNPLISSTHVHLVLLVYLLVCFWVDVCVWWGCLTEFINSSRWEKLRVEYMKLDRGPFLRCGLSQQPLISEAEAEDRDRRVIHPTQINLETTVGCSNHRCCFSNKQLFFIMKTKRKQDLLQHLNLQLPRFKICSFSNIMFI